MDNCKTKMTKKLKIEKGSTWFLYLIAVVPLTVAALADFDIITLSTYVAPMLTIFAGAFIGNEIIQRSDRTRKKLTKDFFSMAGLVLAAAAILGAILQLVGMQWQFLISLGGWIKLLVAVFFVWEGFR